MGWLLAARLWQLATETANLIGKETSSLYLLSEKLKYSRIL